MMHTYTFQLCILSVQRKSCIVIKIKIPETIFRIVNIYCIFSKLYFCSYGIKFRTVHTPERRTLCRKCCFNFITFSGCNCFGFGCHCSDRCTFIAAFRKYCMRQGYGLFIFRIIHNLCANIHIDSSTLFCFQVLSRNLRPLKIHMNLFCYG